MAPTTPGRQATRDSGMRHQVREMESPFCEKLSNFFFPSKGGKRRRQLFSVFSAQGGCSLFELR